MVFLNKRNILLAALLAVLAGLLFAGPPLLGRIITRSLDLPGMKQLVIEGVKSQTNLLLGIQGTRFDPWQGVIFSGVHGSLKDEKGKSHFLIESENAVLKISYWKVLTGEFPVEELVIHQGRLNPAVLDRFEWKQPEKAEADGDDSPASEDENPPAEAASSPPTRDGWQAVAAGKLPADLNFREAARNISVRVEDMNLVLPARQEKKKSADKNNDFLQLNLTASPADQGYDLSADLTAARQAESGGRVRLQGNWIPDGERRLEISFEDISSALLPAFGSVYPVLPEDIRKSLSTFRLENGVIQGGGQVDFGGETIHLNITGEYQELNLKILARQHVGLYMHDAAGTFEAEAHFTGIAEPESFQFKAEQPGLRLDLAYSEEKDPETKRKKRVRNLKIKGRLELSEGREDLSAYLINAPVYGTLRVDSNMSYKNKDDIIPDFEVGVENLDIRLPAMFARSSRPDDTPRLTVESGQATQKDEELVLKTNGKLLGFPFQLAGEGSVRFDRITFEDRRTRDITNDLDLDVIVSEVEYGDLALMVGRLYQHIMLSGTAKNAPKAEDGGPLFKLNFARRFLYKGLLKPLKLDADIVLKKRNSPDEVMPDNLEINISKHHGSAEFKIPTQRSDNAKIYYRYELSFYNNLPRHEMLLELYIKNNRYALRPVLGSGKPPGYFEMTYSYRGDGWFPYDLIHWSYSSMYLELEDVTLGNVAPFNVIRHSLNLPGEEYKLDKLRFSRSTNTREVEFRNIRMYNDELDIDGRGTFDLPADGSLRLNYEYQPEGAEDEIDGRMRLKLTEEGKWIPAS